MKLKFMSLVVILSLMLSCGTTTTTTSTSSSSDNAAFAVPATITTNFTSQYPTATNVVWSAYDMNGIPVVDWELAGWPAMTPADYTVRFDIDGQNYYGWYDANGNWVGSAYTINEYNTLPAAITNTINTQFAGYAIDGVQREFWKDNNGYEIKLKKADGDKVKLLIDSNGNLIKQKK